MENSDILIHMGLVALSTGGFYLLFHLLFNKGHHFQFNRILILSSLIFSFIFPFLSFNVHQPFFEAVNQFDIQQVTDLWAVETLKENEITGKLVKTAFSFLAGIFIIYALGVLIFFIRYIVKLSSIIKIIRQNEKIEKDQYTIVKLKEGTPTFSFAHFIFSDQLPGPQNKAIFDHEKCHVIHRHSYDLLLVEFLLVLQWFNPFIYLFKNRLVEIHEFLADENVLKQGHGKVSYLKHLGAAAGIHFPHQFTSSFYSNILKRIQMINRNKSVRIKLWKAVIPFVFAATIVFTYSGFNGQLIVPDNHLLKLQTDQALQVKFHLPLRKDKHFKVTSGFGMRMHPILKEKRMHNGIDYAAKKGVKIFASASGVVRKATYNKNYGNYLIIDHENGFSSLYAQMEAIRVKEGEKVNVDYVIGTVGSSGLSTAPHLHFEIMKDGKHVNPDDYLEPYQ